MLSLSIADRLDWLCARYPDFPRAQIALIRQAKLLAKKLQDSTNALLRPHGLAYAEYNLLIMAASHAGVGCSPSALTAATGEKSANITRLTNALCDKGLLDRGGDVEDRRRVTLSLTRQGAELLGALVPSINHLARRQLAGFSDAEITALMALMTRWHEQLD